MNCNPEAVTLDLTQFWGQAKKSCWEPWVLCIILMFEVKYQINWFPKERYQTHTKTLSPSAIPIKPWTTRQWKGLVCIPLISSCYFPSLLAPSGEFLQTIPCTVLWMECCLLGKKINYQFLFLFAGRIALVQWRNLPVDRVVASIPCSFLSDFSYTGPAFLIRFPPHSTGLCCPACTLPCTMSPKFWVICFKIFLNFYFQLQFTFDITLY